MGDLMPRFLGACSTRVWHKKGIGYVRQCRPQTDVPLVRKPGERLEIKAVRSTRCRSVKGYERTDIDDLFMAIWSLHCSNSFPPGIPWRVTSCLSTGLWTESYTSWIDSFSTLEPNWTNSARPQHPRNPGNKRGDTRWKTNNSIAINYRKHVWKLGWIHGYTINISKTSTTTRKPKCNNAATSTPRSIHKASRKPKGEPWTQWIDQNSRQESNNNHNAHETKNEGCWLSKQCPRTQNTGYAEPAPW